MLLNGIMGALHNFTTPEFWIAIALGSIIGLIVGIIPGISGMVAIALMMSFIFKMSPLLALPMMMAILGIQFFGGAISSILINLPGTPGNAATLLDGFPMAQKGEAGRAIGAAEASAFLGNTLTTLASLALIPAMLPIIIAITTADMVFIILTGITFVSVLSAGSMIKGVISGGIGLMIAFVGYQQTTAVARFTFDSLYLYDGIRLIPLCLGLFGVPEMVALAARGGTISQQAIEFKGMKDVWRGVKDVFVNWALVVRCNVIGLIVGIIPALGSASAAFIAYGQAKQSSKHPEKFGTGCVEGVIAPETANHASVAGDLLITLALGIPGSAPMAILLGAMLILGLTPGPEMVTKHLDMSLTLLWVLILTAVIGSSICLPLAPQLAKIAYIPAGVLTPVVIVIAFVGSYVSEGTFNDIISLVVFSALGLVMRRYRFNRPSLFLAYILGGLLEKNFFLAVKISGPLFFVRPISLTLICLIIAMYTFQPIKRLFQRRGGVKA